MSGCPYFWPLAVSMTARDEHDLHLRREVRVTAAMIFGVHQEQVSDACPTRATTQYIESSLWDPFVIGFSRREKDGDRARPVQWSVFSCHSHGAPLQIVWFDPAPSGCSTRVKVDVYGVPLREMSQLKTTLRPRDDSWGAKLAEFDRLKKTIIAAPPLVTATIPPPACPEGMEWSEKHGRCVPKMNAPDPKDKKSNGWHWIEIVIIWGCVLLTASAFLIAAFGGARERWPTDVCTMRVVFTTDGKTFVPVFYEDCQGVLQTWTHARPQFPEAL
jgi:hypothetical protein